MAVILKGTLSEVADEELALKVRQTNRHGASYRSAAAILVSLKGTRVTLGRKDRLSTNDPVLIKARVCRSKLLGAPALTAKRVVLLGKGVFRR